MVNKPIFLYLIAGCFILTSACNIGVSAAPKQIDYDAINTIAAQTVAALQTQSALKATSVGAVHDSNEGKIQPGEALASATSTRMPTASLTPVPPTLVPTSTPLPPTPIPPTPVPCNWVMYIDDVSVPDNTAFYPNLTFTKTWRLKNIGTCVWTSDYQVVFASGEAMGGPVSQKLDQVVNPGGFIDLSIKLTAPSVLGSHSGNWMLRTPSGAMFGLGKNQSKPFWVMINVISLPTINVNTPLDIAANYCAAIWTNSGGTTLSCPAQNESITTGSIMRNDAPRIEKDSQDDEATLITIPNNGQGGKISGRFPDVVINSGDHFRALTGCMANSLECSVGFAVKYSADGGSVQTLSTWTEIYDGKWTRPDIDLSFLAGKHVQIILEVSNSNDSSTDDRAFWMVPKIGP
jgi:hypothetical protein